MLHKAARRMVKHNLTVDEIKHRREMEVRAKGDFTRRIGELILRSGISPMEFLGREMRNPDNEKSVRIQCAIAMLPYIHSKVATETRVSATPGSTVNFVTVQQNDLEALSEEEFAQLCSLSEKLGPKDMGAADEVVSEQ